MFFCAPSREPQGLENVLALQIGEIGQEVRKGEARADLARDP
ncbi:MAG: hypothetical protein H6Q00_2925 [Holophagaceae bacterium]|nr:hypothetical protein [Holophagaceae bacterium]